MIKIKECKKLARETLLGRYGTVIGAGLVAGIIEFFLLMAAGFSLLFALIYGNVFDRGAELDTPMIVLGAVLFTVFLFLFIIMAVFANIGSTRLMLNICHGRRYSVADVFYGFTKGSHAGRAIGVTIALFVIALMFSILQNIVIYCFSWRIGNMTEWAVCAAVLAVLIIAQLYVCLGLFLADLIAVEEPGYGVFGCLKRSMELMKGKRLKALWFILFSFIGWQIVLLLCPFAAIWIYPYISCSRTVFYLAAKDELDLLPDTDYAHYGGNASMSEAEDEHRYQEKESVSGDHNCNETEPEPKAAESSEEKESFEEAAKKAGISEAFKDPAAGGDDNAGDIGEADKEDTVQ